MSDAAKSQQLATSTATATLGCFCVVCVAALMMVGLLNQIDVTEFCVTASVVAMFGVALTVNGGRLIGWVSNQLFFGTCVPTRVVAVAMAVILGITAFGWFIILCGTWLVSG